MSKNKSHNGLALDWQQCSDWLLQCQQIAHQRKLPFTLVDALPTTWSEESISSGENNAVVHLISILRDGVLLCQLLSVLSNNQVDPRNEKDFCTRTQNSPFLWNQNIRLFLRLCSATPFNLSSEQLFDPADLYEARNFGKVLNTLSCLSKCAAAHDTGISGFPSSNHQIRANHEYYNTLEDVAGQSSTLRHSTVNPANHDVVSQASGDEYDVEQETIYDTVIQKGDNLQVVVAPAGDTSTVHRSKRDHCILELLNTEKNFVEVLRIILEEYKKPLTKYLSTQEIETIFRFIDRLHDIHRDFMGDLNLAVNSTSRTLITLPEAVSRFGGNLLIYGKYCGHIDQAQSLLLDLMANEGEKRAALEHCQQRSKESKFSLKDLLMVPMQRVLKYHLLLQTLVKATPEDHSDYMGLKAALEEMRTVANYINEVKRDLETIEIVDKIQSKIEEIFWPEGKKLTDYGRRVKDGELKVANNPMGTGCKIRHVFLFDRTLLLCKPKKDSYEFKQAVHVNNSQVSILSEQATTRRSEKWSYGFLYELRGPSKDPTQTMNNTANAAAAAAAAAAAGAASAAGAAANVANPNKFYFFAKTPELRREWIDAFTLAQANNCPPGARTNGYHFEMCNFETPTQCNVCEKLLLGAFYQGYRCKETKTVAHKECIQRLTLSTNQSESQPEAAGVDTTDKGSNIQRSGSNPLPSWNPGSTGNSSPSPMQVGNTWAGGNGTLSPMGAGSSQGVARSTTSYNGLSPLPPSHRRPVLPFPQNVMIELLSKEDLEWWKGRYNKQEGWFPSNAVVECRKMPPTSSLRRTSDVDLPPSPTVAALSLPRDNQTWFVGLMDRNRATASLAGMPNGTFLVRLSENSTRLYEYTISVMYDTPKHLRIHRVMDGPPQYYLHEVRKFSSVPELVTHFTKHHLGSIFPGVDTTLRYPLGEIRGTSVQLPNTSSSQPTSTAFSRAPSNASAQSAVFLNGMTVAPTQGPLFQVVAIHEFVPTHDRQLALKPGDIVSVLGQDMDGRGWWRGSLQGQIGFFPKDYVQRYGE